MAEPGKAAAALTVGEIRIARVVELIDRQFNIYKFFPEATAEALAPHRHWLEPRALEPETDQMVLPIQTYVVRTDHHTILIDTCIGNDKSLAFRGEWHQRRDPGYLRTLAGLGVRPEEVDYVMCTHLHPDHVGWNTRLEDGRWVPTFANAKYLIAREELAFWQAENAAKPVSYFAESVLPVVEAGRAILVDSDHALDDQVWLEPSPGHTPGHVSIRLASKGDDAVMSGDLIHSPIQCVYPEWNSRACRDKARAARTRRDFLEHYSESGALVLTAHFPVPSVGHVVADGAAFRFHDLSAGA